MGRLALHRPAVRVARQLMPTIQVRDADGLRIEHELEVKLLLEG